MSDKNDQTVLLIDGNNLAHFLYTNLTPGQKMTDEMSGQLFTHIGHYGRQYTGRLQIELVLDHKPKVDVDLINNPVRVFSAIFPQTGDDLLMERFWYHHTSFHPCLVITNDDEILEIIRHERGNVLRVYDFVRRAGTHNPVFRDPDDLPLLLPPQFSDKQVSLQASLKDSIHFRISVEQQTSPTRPKRSSNRPDHGFTNLLPTSIVDGAIITSALDLPSSSTALPDTLLGQQDRVLQMESSIDRKPSSENMPIYYLNLDSWPLREGARFLRQSFCAKHRQEYKDLLASIDYDRIEAADVRAIAELLLHSCSQETNFCTRGSLIDRVRLALLQARGEPLSLAELADRTRLSIPGLNRKIKAKAGQWLIIQS